MQDLSIVIGLDVQYQSSSIFPSLNSLCSLVENLDGLWRYSEKTSRHDAKKSLVHQSQTRRFGVGEAYILEANEHYVLAEKRNMY